MNYLLDTHAFLWYLADDPQLPAYAKACIENPNHEIYVSIASFWEITIKHALGKLRLKTPIVEIHAVTQQQEITILPITIQHLVRLQTLPFHHRDPFDRLLIAQSLAEGLDLLSGDRAFAVYPVQCLWSEPG